MILSENWLREWVNPDLNTHDLAHQLTMAGLEVDSVTPLVEGLSGVVVAEIVSAIPHPDADKLRVCQVNTGSETVQIVCGAPNAAEGLKAPLAQPGARLPGGVKIKKAKLRGVESQGMLCSAAELTLSDDHDGLLALASDAPVGTPIDVYLDLNDSLIEIGLTPNRADCLSVAGVARDLAAATDTALTIPEMEPVTPTIDDQFPVDIACPSKCPRYLGRVIRNVEVAKPTPLFMVERLRRAGIRSIDAVVDITNYVMLELGQPLHAFDLDALEGGIVVREAVDKERIVLLDGEERALSEGTLVIADHRKALAIAGIMGGEGSGVGVETQHLFLEAAFFTPELMAGKARQYGLHTDASHRFERGVDPDLAYAAIERATALFLKWVGGQAGPVVDVSAKAELPERDTVILRGSTIEQVLGIQLSDTEIQRMFSALGFTIEADPGLGQWRCTAPSWRFDMGREADLIEEVARLHGFDNIPAQPLSGMGAATVDREDQTPISLLKHRLVARGFNEAITFSFVSPESQRLIDPELDPIALRNPISSDLAVMRTSLIPGLLGVAVHNIKRQRPRVRIFETGLRFFPDASFTQRPALGLLICGSQSPESWSGQSDSVDFYDLKGEVQALLAGVAGALEFRSAVRSGLHDGQTAEVLLDGAVIGVIGRIHPTAASELDLPRHTYVAELDLEAITQRIVPQYQDISRYPETRRDLAVVVDQAVPAMEVLALARSAAGPGVSDALIFDVYEGEGIAKNEKSLAIGLTFRDQSRTLTDEEISESLTQVIVSLEEKFSAKLRH